MGCVLWIHHEAEELRVHHRATIPGRRRAGRGGDPVVLGTGPAAAGHPPRHRVRCRAAVLQRFWGTACRRDEVVYLILFINERCLVLALSG
jgi:hypothetical protein